MKNSWRQGTNVLTMAALILVARSASSQPATGRTTGPVVAVLLKADGAGIVELEAVRGSDRWIKIQPPEKLYLGEALRVGTNSRALVQFSDKETAQFEAGARVLLEPPPGRKSGFAALLGRFYFFHRDKPEDFGIRKGRNWMIVRGTEVVLDVAEGDGPMVVSVLEGEVELDNGLGQTNVVAGEAGVFEAGRAPRKTAMLPAASLIQWCLYYPAVLDADELSLGEDTRAALRESLAAYRQGNLPAALSTYPLGRNPASAAERIYLAALLLSAGQVGAAEGLLEAVSARNVDEGGPAELRDALRVLISVVRGEPNSAAPPPNAVSSSTPSASTLLAASYAEQAQSRLPAALARAKEAVGRSPNFGFGWARVAELEFSSGRIPAAQRALEKSLQLAPRNAQAVALQGFVLAARGQTAQALAHFDQAIALDGALGNAWLGRGLCRIRRGDVVGGRNDLQVAVTLEPNRAVLRSYLGKAFDAAGETKRAFREFELARHWDPNDPTAYLYSALLNQQENRINDAVRDLERSQELNENRRVYRSALLLDQDQAVRGANLAHVYADAGLGDPAFREATRAANLDYANASAHRFLANAYAVLNELGQSDLRYETPQASEYLLSTLLAPVGAGPLSQFVSFQEYGRMFDRDGLHIASSTEYLSRGAWTQSGAQYGRVGNLAYSLDAFYRSDPGQRPNQDLDLLSLSAQVKLELTPQDSVYTQLIHTRTTAGDLNRYYDPAEANPFVRSRDRQEPLFLAGYHRQWTPGSHTLLLFGVLDDTVDIWNPWQDALMLGRIATNEPVAAALPFATTNSYENELSLYSIEAQQILARDRDTFIVGGKFQSGQFETRSESLLPEVVRSGSVEIPRSAFDNPPQEVRTDFHRGSAYGYWQRQVVESLRLIAGVSYDWIESPANHRFAPISDAERSEDQLSPKGGVIWTPHRNTTLRAAYSQSLGGVSVDQSFQLEPSQVAGFNQVWRSLIPESAAGPGVLPRFETWGVAWDQKFGRGTYLGLSGQWLRSDMKRDVGVYDLYPPPPNVANPTHLFPSGTRQSFDYEEKSLTVSLNQLVGQEWAFGARYQLSHARLETVFPDIPVGAEVTEGFQREQDTRALLHHAHLFALYNHRSGFFSQFDALWLKQDNDGYTPARPGDDFWQFNASLGYRLPRRRAEIRLGVLNLADRDYRLNPLNLIGELPRERTFFASFRFSF